MATATISRIYQIHLPDDPNSTPDDVLSAWLENARAHPETFDVLVQDDVDGLINETYIINHA